MKNTRKLVLAFLSTVALLASCRKDEVEDPGHYTHYRIVNAGQSTAWDMQINGMHATPGWQSTPACHGDTCLAVAFTDWVVRFDVAPVCDTLFSVGGLVYYQVQEPYDFRVEVADLVGSPSMAHLVGAVGDTLPSLPVVVSFPSP
jgi:hypothetical protein